MLDISNITAAQQLKALRQHLIDKKQLGLEERLRCEWEDLNRQCGNQMGNYPRDINTEDAVVEMGAQRLLDSLGTNPVYAPYLEDLFEKAS